MVMQTFTPHEEIRISVVCPTFNASSYILPTLNSLKDQITLPYEVIISDDGSSDDTEELVLAFSQKYPQVNLILEKNKHGGPGSARNRGIARATGNWIAFLDSDDVWLPKKICTVEKVIRTHPCVNFICHSETVVRNNLKTRDMIYQNFYCESKGLPVQLYQVNFFSTSAVTCKKELLIKYGLFDEKLMSGQDYELWLKLSPYLNVKFVKEIMGLYVERKGNITSGSMFKRYRNLMIILWRHRDKATKSIVLKQFSWVAGSFFKRFLLQRVAILMYLFGKTNAIS